MFALCVLNGHKFSSSLILDKFLLERYLKHPRQTNAPRRLRISIIARRILNARSSVLNNEIDRQILHDFKSEQRQFQNYLFYVQITLSPEPRLLSCPGQFKLNQYEHRSEI